MKLQQYPGVNASLTAPRKENCLDEKCTKAQNNRDHFGWYPKTISVYFRKSNRRVVPEDEEAGPVEADHTLSVNREGKSH